MPNEVVTRADSTLPPSGDHLTVDHAAAILAEIMQGADQRDPDRGLSGRPARQGRDGSRAGRSSAHDALPCNAGRRRARGPGRHRRDRRRPDDLQRFDHGGAGAAAAAGCAVAKHGNRSSTTKCGTADLLEALGVDIELDPNQVVRCIEEVGFGFMFAPRYHAAMANVVPVRKELAVGTVFNLLGPLTNPAGASRQLIGIADRRYQETIAEALIGLGSERAMVVAAEDGLDEISIAGRTRVIEVSGGSTEEWFVEPGDVGLDEADLGQVAGGTPEETRRPPAPYSPARAARAVTSCCSMLARRSTWAAALARWPTGSPTRRRRSTRVRPRPWGTGWSRRRRETAFSLPRRFSLPPASSSWRSRGSGRRPTGTAAACPLHERQAAQVLPGCGDSLWPR